MAKWILWPLGQVGMAINYYTGTSSINYFGSGARTEPDLRQEMINTLDGFLPEIAKSQTGIIRRVRRNADNIPVKCSCRDSITTEPDRDIYCPLCMGIGYLFDEEYIDFYKVLFDKTFSSLRRHHMIEPGLIDASSVVFYFKYDAAINKEDRILEIQLDVDGNISSPVTCLGVYKIDKSWEYRSDNGRIEFWKVIAHEELLKFINPPGFGE